MPPGQPYTYPEFDELVSRMVRAREAGRPVVLMMGAHPVKLGLSRFLIDLLKRRIATHLAVNGAALIHDFELALVAGTSEDVARWIAVGQFGLWCETSRMNDIIAQAAGRDEGLGEAVGRVIEEENFPHGELSLAAAGWRLGIPVTCHVGVGSDILHAMTTASISEASSGLRIDEPIPTALGMNEPAPTARYCRREHEPLNTGLLQDDRSLWLWKPRFTGNSRKSTPTDPPSGRHAWIGIASTSCAATSWSRFNTARSRRSAGKSAI
jgi:hypothetical protein